ncbi:MAG: SDR family NAD(P)-dependent oxidoreductase [Thermomicrobiales bacterium]
MNAGRLKDKTALVTGSTRGLGRTTAEWLAREGANVVVSGRGDAAVADSVKAVETHGVRSWGIPADLAVVSEAHRLAEETLARVDQLDILVNNAGMSIQNNFWNVSDAEWDIQVNANWRSSFILAQHAARHMMERKISGRIVNTSSIGARACHTDRLVYDSSKGAIETMTRNMAYELAPYGISVNCVAPGNMAERPGAGEEAWWPAATAKIPFGRLGNADDIAAAVLYFCLPESAFTTGQTLLVDGGHDTYLPEF